jgi:hypothetical protein
MSRNFKQVLDGYIDWLDQFKPTIESATIAVTERYARRRLYIKRKEPLVYRGLQLKCIGSKAWRIEQQHK